MNKQQRLDWMPRRIVEDMAAACGEDPNGDREALVIAYQMSVGLSADGWAGVKTAQSLYGSGLPIARNRRELTKQVGSFDWVRSGKGRRIKWTGAKPDVVRVELFNGDHANIHRLFADEFAAAFELACDVSGYTPESVQSYNPRTIGKTDDLSMHALAVAFDADPTLNPWGGVILKGKQKGKPSMMRRFPLFHEVFEWLGWRWGGRWEGGKGDDMHCQRKS